MFFFVFVVSLISFIAWYQLTYRRRNELMSKIPSPKSYPLIRNTLEFYGKSPKELFRMFEVLKNSLGPIYHLTMHPLETPVFVLSDPKAVEAVLTSQKILNKSDDYDLVAKWMGNGLLVSTGKKWRQRRKIMTPSFHFQILENFAEIMDEQGNIFVEKIMKLNGQEVDVFPLLSLFALDVICESAMGYKMNAQANKDSEYVRAVKGILQLVFERSFDVVRKIDFIYQYTQMYRDEIKYLKVLHGLADSVIKSRRDELLNKTNSPNTEETGETKRKMALLDMLLQSTVDGIPLTNEDIREEVDTFMFAGHDTTTSAMSFCLHNIAKNPEIQKKVYEEIQLQIGDDKTLNLQHLNSLNYLELVIKETLRMYPIVPFYGRQLTEEATLGNYTLPAGSNIVIAAFLMGRDPTIFPDPLIFNPSRFDVERTTDKVNPFAYVPFSAGPRSCLGQRFAMYEMKMCISKIIQNFELSVSKERENLDVYGDVVLKSDGGIVLKIQARK